MNKTTTHRFPNSTASTIHQDGTTLSQAAPGLEVTLHWRDGLPVSAEVYSDDGSEYGDIGLRIHVRTLDDFDGCFCLPAEVSHVLRLHGFQVPPSCEADDARRDRILKGCGRLLRAAGWIGSDTVRGWIDRLDRHYTRADFRAWKALAAAARLNMDDNTVTCPDAGVPPAPRGWAQIEAGAAD